MWMKRTIKRQELVRAKKVEKLEKWEKTHVQLWHKKKVCFYISTYNLILICLFLIFENYSNLRFDKNYFSEFFCSFFFSNFIFHLDFCPQKLRQKIRKCKFFFFVIIFCNDKGNNYLNCVSESSTRSSDRTVVIVLLCFSYYAWWKKAANILKVRTCVTIMYVRTWLYLSII